MARFVDARRLAGGADEHAGEQVGQGRMMLPVGDQAHQQIRPAQAGRVGRAGGAQRDVVAAAGAGVAPVEHEFLGAEARQARLFVKRLGVRHQLRPACRRMNVDFDDAGVGRDAEFLEARVGRRRIAFEAHREFQVGGGGFDGGE